MMRVFSALIFFVTAAGFSISGFSMGDNKPKGAFQVHGHRGARAHESENSLAGFQLAIEHGVDVIEADMVLTKDRKIVLNHDLTINTIFCHSKDLKLKKLKQPRVDSLTLKQIQTYDCSASADPEFPSQKLRPGTSIPTLRDLLRLAKKHHKNQPDLKLNLETVLSPDADYKFIRTFVQLLLKDLRDENFPPKNVIVQSFDFRSLRELRSSAPRIEISALVDEGYDFESVTQKLQPNYLSPHGSHISKSQVMKAHQLNIKVIPWTLNKRSHWSHFIGMGVDGIITDDPIGLMNYLKE